MTVEQLIKELQKWPSDYTVFSMNDHGAFRVVDKVEKDDNYDDLLICAGDQE